jgi:hypothetical protein
MSEEKVTLEKWAYLKMIRTFIIASREDAEKIKKIKALLSAFNVYYVAQLPETSYEDFYEKLKKL